MHSRGSLKRLLTTWLVAPLLALILLSALPAYKLAVDAANEAYDNGLLNPAIAISRYVRLTDERFEVDLPPVALEALRVDSADRIFFRVTGPNGDLIAGNAAIPAPDIPVPAAGHTFYNTRVGNVRVRVAAVSVPRRYGEVLVQVAETTSKRDGLVKEILAGTLIPALVVAIAAGALVWFGIRRSLAPLATLKQEIERRSPSDLSPVPGGDSPEEVRPLLDALNRLLARLDAALGAQQRFIANAAHQLRTPLAGLRTHVSLARRNPASPETGALLDMIAGETDQASHLANQLLTLARAEPGTGRPDLHQPVNLREIANNTAQTWVRTAVDRNIDLGFELEDASTPGDPLLLRELLANLVDNALAYTPSEGTVTVRTRAQDGQAVIEVEDDGPGIPESEREKIFERFYRIPGTAGGGCGLGLAIVREIAGRHGARVILESPPGGRGTLARVSFPLIRKPGR
ncbi:MAG: sensor histidine kinase [Burkholderiales bacterium]|nr:sensor histidine kinase [Burkholderiales bacterium]